MSLRGIMQVLLKQTLLKQTQYVTISTKLTYRNYGVKSLWNSFRSKLGINDEGKLVGEDLYGNKYYEREDRSRKRKTKRWIQRDDDPELDEQFLQDFDIPVEWRAWLQFKRNSPPTEMEIKKNMALMMRTKQRAIEVEEREAKEREEMGLKKVDTSKIGESEFPVYEEYEILPKFEKSKSKSSDQDVHKLPKK